MELVGLADKRDGGTDGGDVEDRSAFAPRRGFIPARQDEDCERVAQKQRRKCDRTSDRSAEEIPVVGHEEDDTGAD